MYLLNNRGARLCCVEIFKFTWLSLRLCLNCCFEISNSRVYCVNFGFVWRILFLFILFYFILFLSFVPGSMTLLYTYTKALELFWSIEVLINQYWYRLIVVAVIVIWPYKCIRYFFSLFFFLSLFNISFRLYSSGITFKKPRFMEFRLQPQHFLSPSHTVIAICLTVWT